MTRFRVAHLTDLHFGRKLDWLNPADSTESGMGAAKEAIRNVMGGKTGPIFYPSTFNPDAALSLLDWLIDECLQLDAVLVTGDLATTGEAADLELASQYFAGKVPTKWSPAPLPDFSAVVDTPLLTLPGNHDRYGQFAQPAHVKIVVASLTQPTAE